MTTPGEPGKKTILFLGADAGYLFAFRGPVMRWFLARDYRVVAVAPALGHFDPAVFEAMGVTFRSWPLKKAALDPVADIGPVVALWRILKQERPDILFTHTIKPVIYGQLLARLAGVPRRTAMIPGLGYAFIAGQGLKRHLVGWLGRAGYRLALGGAHIVLFQNADDRNELARLGALPNTTPTGLVNGSGVDMDHYAPRPSPDVPFTFVMVARLLKDKGVREYVEAARIVRRTHVDTRFLLVGGTDPNPAAIPQAEVDGWVAQGLIEAPGNMADPRGAYARGHAFVLPSYREGTPRTNLEAMAMGLPVITTDAPGCRETAVDGVTGFRVPVADAQALALAMLALVGDPERARAMGQAGRELCRTRFELATVTQATGQLLAGHP